MPNQGIYRRFYLLTMALKTCPECGNTISDRATICPKCGTPLQPTAAPQQSAPQGFTQQVYNCKPQRPQLTPEQDAYLDKFSWGGFGLSWIWALCNDLVIYGLIGLVVGLLTSGIGAFIVAIVFGIKGRRWAWEKSTTVSLDEFVEKQEPWEKWGRILVYVACIVLILFCLFLFSHS